MAPTDGYRYTRFDHIKSILRKCNIKEYEKEYLLELFYVYDKHWNPCRERQNFLPYNFLLQRLCNECGYNHITIKHGEARTHDKHNQFTLLYEQGAPHVRVQIQEDIDRLHQTYHCVDKHLIPELAGEITEYLNVMPKN